MRKKITMYVLMILTSIAILYGAYRLGRREEHKITWLSELTQRTVGKNIYALDLRLVCLNGKDLGVIQVDLNLTNSKFRIVRNDPGLEPNCNK